MYMYMTFPKSNIQIPFYVVLLIRLCIITQYSNSKIILEQNKHIYVK
jgi:hypothetical protein